MQKMYLPSKEPSCSKLMIKGWGWTDTSVPLTDGWLEKFSFLSALLSETSQAMDRAMNITINPQTQNQNKK